MTKKQKVLNLLKTGRPITSLIAFQQTGSMRLGAVVFQLKKEGHNIISEEKKDLSGTRYVAYHYVAPESEQLKFQFVG